MALRLTIDVFSGRGNPQVVLDGDPERELLTRMRPEGQVARGTRRLPAPLSVLGYRGLLVEQLGRPAAGLPKAFRVANGDLIGEGIRNRARDEHVEEYVCGTTGPFRVLGLGEDFHVRTLKEISRYRKLREEWRERRHRWPRRNSCRCAPLYEPAWWNNDPTRLGCNNCYNYSTNYRTDNFAQPGMASGVSHNTTCPTVIPAAVADGLINSPTANNRCPAEGHLVALVMAPGYDYHWYRKGRNGYWTHKPGSTPVTNVDNNGNLIPDPRTAARGVYTQFCTFMVVMHGHIKLKGPYC
jgi:hypothetical protein